MMERWSRSACVEADTRVSEHIELHAHMRTQLGGSRGQRVSRQDGHRAAEMHTGNEQASSSAAMVSRPWQSSV